MMGWIPELIARWKSGDERAASALVARHASALARFAVASGRTKRGRRVGAGHVRASVQFARRFSRRELVSNVVVHDRAAAAGRPAAGGEAAARPRRDSGGRRVDGVRRARLGVVASETERRMRQAMTPAVADAEGGLYASGGGRIVVQGNCRGGGNDRRRRAGALPQRDARCEGVSR